MSKTKSLPAYTKDYLEIKKRAEQQECTLSDALHDVLKNEGKKDTPTGIVIAEESKAGKSLLKWSKEKDQTPEQCIDNMLTVIANSICIPETSEAGKKITALAKQDEKTNEDIILQLTEAVNPNSCLLVLNDKKSIDTMGNTVKAYMQKNNLKEVDETTFLMELCKVYTDNIKK